MKAYTRIAGRPIGRIPEVWLVRPPEISDDIGTPWSVEIEEWDSVELAIDAILDYLPLEFCLKMEQKGHKDYFDYYNAFRIITGR